MRAALLLALLASPASAATWTTAPSEMIRTGECGSGAVVVSDGCDPILVSAEHEAKLAPFGQFVAGGWNTQDTDAAEWRIWGLTGAQSVRLEIHDAHDQPASFVTVTIGGAVWTRDRQPNGNVWVIDLGEPDGDALLVRIETGLNDGLTARAMSCWLEG